MIILVAWLLVAVIIIFLGNIWDNQMIIGFGAAMLIGMTAAAAASW